jgi:ankyrin repeat protein
MRDRHLLRGLRLAVLAAATTLMPLAHAGAYEDFFKALQLDLAQSVKSLLERGFDPNSVDPERRDPALVYAVRFESIKVLPVLLSSPQINIEAKAPNGDTALMVAAYKGEKEAVALLLDKGAEPNRPGWTALHYAAASGSVEIVKMLLEKSAYIDAESPNKTTPLMMAAASGKTSVVELLTAEGADQTLKNDRGMTAHDFAVKFADVTKPASMGLPMAY